MRAYTAVAWAVVVVACIDAVSGLSLQALALAALSLTLALAYAARRLPPPPVAPALAVASALASGRVIIAAALALAVLAVMAYIGPRRPRRDMIVLAAPYIASTLYAIAVAPKVALVLGTYNPAPWALILAVMQWAALQPFTILAVSKPRWLIPLALIASIAPLTATLLPPPPAVALASLPGMVSLVILALSKRSLH